jgi:hypothetical protein
MTVSVTTSVPGTEDVNDTVLQLKGHEAEVRDHPTLKSATNPKLVRFSYALGTPSTTTY